jgi:hypothetical protein
MLKFEIEPGAHLAFREKKAEWIDRTQGSWSTSSPASSSLFTFMTPFREMTITGILRSIVWLPLRFQCDIPGSNPEISVSI